MSSEHYFSPGRVNIIGDHIDYNGGRVFPAALDRGTYGDFSKRDDKEFVFYSCEFSKNGNENYQFDDIGINPEYGWVNYVFAVIMALSDAGYKIDTGFNMRVESNIPSGSGLSSSASLELLIIKALSDMYGFDIDKTEMALIGQAAENKYMGVNSGIMDQFAIAVGKKDMGILLDTNTLEYTYVPMELKEAVFVIACTNKKRELTDSKYNERRSECERALLILKKSYEGLDNLCKLKSEDLTNISKLLGDDVLFRRVKHVVTENERTYRFMDAFSKGDMKAAGEIMCESHMSLRDDYEVTGRELDAIYEGALKSKACLGIRMTGAGFGGCAIALVETAGLKSFMKEAGEYYKEVVGYDATFFEVGIGDCPMKLPIDLAK